MSEDLLRCLSIEIHSILIAEQEPITASQLSDKYEDIMGYYIDAKRYGFPNLDLLLRSLTDAVCVVPNPIRNARPTYRAVSTAETKDIESLVRRQMTKEEQIERKRRGSMPRRRVERPQTQFGAAFRYKSADAKGALPGKRGEQQMTASTQKMVPVSGGSVSRFSTNYDAADDMGDSVQPMATPPPTSSTQQPQRRLVDDPSFHPPAAQNSSMMAFGAQVMSASAYKQQQSNNSSAATMYSRSESMDQHHRQQSRPRASSTEVPKKPSVAPPPPPQPTPAQKRPPPTLALHHPRLQFETPAAAQKSESATRSVSSTSSYDSHGIASESIFYQMMDEEPLNLGGGLYETVMTMFRKEGDRVVFREHLPRHLLSIFNLNPDFFQLDYKDESGVRVTLKKMFNRTTLRSTGHSVRPAMEFDIAWIAKTHNVLNPLQRYEAIAVVHMISPSTFLVCSLFGNENPMGARFEAVNRHIAPYHKDGKLRKVTNFSPGMGCIICFQGVFARAVLLSQSETLLDHLRFILMDIHSVVEVDVSNVFYILPELETKHIPCNLFLARIHGVGPIAPAPAMKYQDYIGQQSADGASMTTACIIRSVDRKYFGIDFALNGEWFSERLISRGQATPYVCTPTSRQISKEALPPTGPIFDLIKVLIADGAYDYKPTMRVTDTTPLRCLSPEIYPGYKEVLKKICSRPSSAVPQPRRFASPPPPPPVLSDIEITVEEEPLKSEVEDEEDEFPGLLAEGRAPSADLSGFRSSTPLEMEYKSRQLIEKEEELKVMEIELIEEEQEDLSVDFETRRLAKLITVIDEMRSGDDDIETDAMIASMMWGAAGLSEEEPEWTQQLMELATDLGSRHIGLHS